MLSRAFCPFLSSSMPLPAPTSPSTKGLSPCAWSRSSTSRPSRRACAPVLDPISGYPSSSINHSEHAVGSASSASSVRRGPARNPGAAHHQHVGIPRHKTTILQNDPKTPPSEWDQCYHPASLDEAMHLAKAVLPVARGHSTPTLSLVLSPSSFPCFTYPCTTETQIQYCIPNMPQVCLDQAGTMCQWLYKGVYTRFCCSWGVTRPYTLSILSDTGDSNNRGNDPVAGARPEVRPKMEFSHTFVLQTDASDRWLGLFGHSQWRGWSVPSTLDNEDLTTKWVPFHLLFWSHFTHYLVCSASAVQGQSGPQGRGTDGAGRLLISCQGGVSCRPDGAPVWVGWWGYAVAGYVRID